MKFGEKVRVRYNSFTNEEKTDVHSGFYPMIQVYGEWAYIKDSTYETGMVNCDRSDKARKLGKELLIRVKQKEEKSFPTLFTEL